MFSRPKFLFLVSLLFVALLNPKFNPYLLFKFLIFYHSIYIQRESIYIPTLIYPCSMVLLNSLSEKQAAHYTSIEAVNVPIPCMFKHYNFTYTS